MNGRPGSFLHGGLAVLGGLVLAESLFMPWYSLDVTVAGARAGATHSAWQSMTLMDVLLLLAALAAIASGAILTRRGEVAPVVCAAGVAAVLMSLAGLVDLPDSGLAAVPGDEVAVGRRAGPFVALVASAGIAFAGFASILRPWSQRPGTRRPRRGSRPRARAGSY
jgi:4-amino-4-deoxy-L-arabinose transferase-like glycosyltransferase